MISACKNKTQGHRGLGLRHFVLGAGCLVLMGTGLMACGHNNTVASGGSATDVGNARVSGHLYDTLGEVAPQTEVQLIPFDADLHKDSTLLVRTVVTDTFGAYAFDSVTVGRYRLQGLRHRDGLRVLKYDVEVAAGTGSSLQVTPDTLRQPGSLWIPLQADSALDSTAYVYATGTRVFAWHRADTAQPGFLRIDSIPAGILRNLTLVPRRGGVARKLYSRIKVLPGLITTVDTVFSGAESLWKSADLGEVGYPGGAAFSQGQFLLSGEGAKGITEDAFRFTYVPMLGEGGIEVRLDKMGNPSGSNIPDTLTQAALCIRQNLRVGAIALALVYNPSGKLSVFTRSDSGKVMQQDTVTQVDLTLPLYLRLTRIQNTVRLIYSQDGESWTAFSQFTLSLTTSTYVGMGVSSRKTKSLSSATFSNLNLSGGGFYP